MSHAIYPSLNDKTVVITGGAEGIGAATVELFCRQGSIVIFFDISEPSSKTLIEKITADSKAPDRPSWTPPISIPIFYHCDVTNLTQLKDLAQQVLTEHGTVHILVNNAAAAGAKSRVPSTEVTPDSWDFDINVNLRHQFFLTQAFVPTMIEAGSGSTYTLE